MLPDQTVRAEYNILLKDDKGYSYVRISPGPYSRLTAFCKRPTTRHLPRAVYELVVVRQTVAEANKAFMLPTCNKKFPQEFRKSRPC